MNYIRFGQRLYIPQYGIWLNMDMLGFAGETPNWYQYVWNNPVTFTDPSGRKPRVGFHGGKVINCTKSAVRMVWDTYDYVTGTRYEYTGNLSPGWQTNPDVVDIDYLYGIPPGNPWLHIPGNDGGLFICDLSEPHLLGNFCTGWPDTDDGTGWPKNYGNDQRLIMTMAQMLANGYVSSYKCPATGVCCCRCDSPVSGQTDYSDCSCDQIPDGCSIHSYSPCQASRCPSS